LPGEDDPADTLAPLLGIDSSKEKRSFQTLPAGVVPNPSPGHCPTIDEAQSDILSRIEVRIVEQLHDLFERSNERLSIVDLRLANKGVNGGCVVRRCRSEMDD
jgi:hypothetical protein